MKWYVVQVLTGKEEAFKSELLESVEKSKLESYIQEVVVPVSPKDSEGNSEKVFPGYVLVRAEMSGEIASFILRVNGASKFAGGMPPVPLRKREVEKVFNIKPVKVSASVNVKISEGMQVKVNSGPFAGFWGSVESFDSEKNVAIVSVSIFGRKNSISVDARQLEFED